MLLIAEKGTAFNGAFLWQISKRENAYTHFKQSENI